MMNYLCEQGCDVTVVTDEGQSILHLAAMSGSLKVMKLAMSQSGVDSHGKVRIAIDVQDSFGATPFLISCAMGKVSVMEYLLEQGCNIFHRGGKEDRLNSALHLSVSGGHIEATRWLLDHGLDPKSPNESGQTPLDVSRLSGSQEVAEMLSDHLSKYSSWDRLKAFLEPALETALASQDLARGVAVLQEMVSVAEAPAGYVSEKDGNSFLHLAAALGCRRLIKQLTRLGLGVNALNSSHMTPLHLAVKGNHLDALTTFQKLGADFNAKDDIGNQIIHLAADGGFDRLVQAIVEHALNEVNSPNEKGWTALHYACSGGHERVVKTLIEAGANATIAEGGITPLHLACYNSHSDIATYLICQSDVDVGHCDASGMCALNIAESKNLLSLLDTLCQREYLPMAGKNFAPVVVQDMFLTATEFGDISLMERMLELGADIDYSRPSDGLTAVTVACEKKNFSALEFLFQNGSNVNCLNGNGFTALHLACSHSNPTEEDLEMILFLLRHEASLNVFGSTGVTPFHMILADQTLSRLLSDDFFASQTIFPDLKNRLGQPPLHIAILAGSLASLDFLLNQTIDINAQDADQATALSLACRCGHVMMSLKLIQKGADVNLCDSKGNSPLSLACGSGNLKLAQLLYDQNADVNLCTKTGDSLLHIACQNGRFVLAKWLVSIGLKLDCLNEAGQSPRSAGLQFNGQKSFQEWLADSKT
jgi:ankyrin repeat protein